MEYNVNLLRPIRPASESFEEEDDNLLTVQVLSKAKDISEDCRVLLTFSKNGLIGFATELLRYANKWKESSHFHIYPIAPGEDLVQVAGVFLTPGSSETIIILSNSEKTITEFASDQTNKKENI